MFGLFKKKEEPGHIAAELTNTPMNQLMTRMLAEELPLLDSSSRVRVYEILDTYDGPQITSQEELPEEIRQLLDL
ncbi:Uncharacterised protein [Corynebacterium kutscheri]|uniref:Uncharacterized protein n=1 Tax=Corynebacterium kutscheri TaxID=35755 RepID=A0A0F6QYR8_9CORY|nr:hypothetical protein [Corynebacterium kutscheri]AKE40315.1 hypothetical protein UL82_00360 [Corynebacterium kutscheri]VEH05454.1 Uncharacterised protein [Corynebacterium kutscheri]VEH10708.1 Uncharacterised protein [Corynebacterium kutscheri]VEH80806.1 Uncharacterised protein [Corynebacterium kutscheri]